MLIKSKLCLVGLVLNHQSLYKIIITNFLNRDYEVTLITRPTLVNSFREFKNAICISIYDDKNDFKILKKSIVTINKSDVIIIDEIYDRFYRGLGIRLRPKKKFLIIHNPNRWFILFYKFNLRFFDTLFFRGFFLNQFQNFITISPNVKDYLEILSPSNCKSFFLPFDFSEKIINKVINEDPIIITIPGSVNESRRNYQNIMEQIQLYYVRKSDSKIQFKLLGRLNEEQADILNLINKINFPVKRIWYWLDYVSDKIFEKEMLSTDYLLSNINVILVKDNRIEIYGQTKETGITYLAYKWAIPLILPYNQIAFREIETQLLRYKEPLDLIKIFESIETQDKHLLRAQSESNFKKFNILIKKEIDHLFRFIGDI